MRLPEGHLLGRPPRAAAGQPMAHKMAAAGGTAQRLSDFWSAWSATMLLG